MSILKVIGIVVATCMVLFALLLIYTLSPTIRNVSRDPAFAHLLRQPLILKQEAYVHQCPKSQYDLVENVLSDRRDNPGTQRFHLQPGFAIRIHTFKTYTNSVSGSTWLYALGDIAQPGARLPCILPFGRTVPMRRLC